MNESGSLHFNQYNPTTCLYLSYKRPPSEELLSKTFIKRIKANQQFTDSLSKRRLRSSKRPFPSSKLDAISSLFNYFQTDLVSQCSLLYKESNWLPLSLVEVSCWCSRSSTSSFLNSFQRFTTTFYINLSYSK